MKEKKMEVDKPSHLNFLQRTNAASDHWAMRPLSAHNSSKLIVLKYFSLPFTLFEPYGAVFIMNSKIHYNIARVLALYKSY